MALCEGKSSHHSTAFLIHLSIVSWSRKVDAMGMTIDMLGSTDTYFAVLFVPVQHTDLFP